VIAEPPNAGVVGQRISEIDIPEDRPIVSVHREGKLYIAHSFTTIQVGNWHTVLQRVDFVPEFRVKLAKELAAAEEVSET
jgi:Trk K+ transport system NAD-binding subunit